MKLSIKKSFFVVSAVMLGLVLPISAGYYHAAGVLPYAYDQHGAVKILVGVSSVHGNKATDFGGLKDSEDGNNPYWTAAREGCEELMFILDQQSDFEEILKKRNKHGKQFDIFKAQSKTHTYLLTQLHRKKSCFCSSSNNYLMHFIQIDYQENLPALFEQRKKRYTSTVPYCWDETVKLVWLDLKKVLEAVTAKKHKNKLEVELYGPFAQSLRAALSTGIIERIIKS